MKKKILYIWGKLLRLLKLSDYSILKLSQRPTDTAIPANTLVIVGHSTMPKWALMKCPCGCKEVLTLSLMHKHPPYWNVSMDGLKRASLSPSVWKNDGCKSHFFLRKGKVQWV